MIGLEIAGAIAVHLDQAGEATGFSEVKVWGKRSSKMYHVTFRIKK